MKRIVCMLAAMTMVLAIYAEKRIYFFRAKDLPTDIETIDLRPDMGLTQLTLNNIYADSEARYALFNKKSDSWWQVMVETAKGKTVNLSEVDNSWYLKLKIRRTVDYSLTLVLAGAGTANGYPLPVSKLPANGEWTELSIPLKDFPLLPELTEKYSDNYVVYLRYAQYELAVQSEKDNSERDYHDFESYYLKAKDLYEKAGSDIQGAPEIQALDATYEEVVSGHWLD